MQPRTHKTPTSGFIRLITFFAEKGLILARHSVLCEFGTIKAQGHVAAITHNENAGGRATATFSAALFIRHHVLDTLLLFLYLRKRD